MSVLWRYRPALTAPLRSATLLFVSVLWRYRPGLTGPLLRHACNATVLFVSLLWRYRPGLTGLYLGGFPIVSEF